MGYLQTIQMGLGFQRFKKRCQIICPISIVELCSAA
jgi:hypothetical protein